VRGREREREGGREGQRNERNEAHVHAEKRDARMGAGKCLARSRSETRHVRGEGHASARYDTINRPREVGLFSR